MARKRHSGGSDVKTEEPTAPETAPARVLVTGPFGKINDVVQLSPELLAQGVAAGQVDPHPDAVAYASLSKG